VPVAALLLVLAACAHHGAEAVSADVAAGNLPETGTGAIATRP
jgi:hypothetical protein